VDFGLLPPPPDGGAMGGGGGVADLDLLGNSRLGICLAGLYITLADLISHWRVCKYVGGLE
jgi:hypothetical protein